MKWESWKLTRNHSQCAWRMASTSPATGESFSTARASGKIDQNDDKSDPRRSRQPQGAGCRWTSWRRRPESTWPAPGAGKSSGPVKTFLNNTQPFKKHSVCFASFSFWSRSCPYILDSLVVPIRSDQDNKVETCLLKQSNSLLSRPTQTMNRNLTRKAGAWTDLLPKGWMLSFWTAFHHHHILTFTNKLTK